MGYTLYCCDVRVSLNNPFIFVYKTYPPPAPSVLVYFRLPMFRWLVHLENLIALITATNVTCAVQVCVFCMFFWKIDGKKISI